MQYLHDMNCVVYAMVVMLRSNLIWTKLPCFKNAYTPYSTINSYSSPFMMYSFCVFPNGSSCIMAIRYPGKDVTIFLAFLLQLSENLGKTSTTKLNRPGIEPGPAAWEILILALGHSCGLGYSDQGVWLPCRRSGVRIPVNLVMDFQIAKPFLYLWEGVCFPNVMYRARISIQMHVFT